MKKYFAAVLAFALALTVVAPVATSAQMMASTSYAFNTNLTVGSRGADVVALQSFLESKGLLSMPAGVAKGYFGGLTKTSLKAYQSMKGIVPVSGYFGPITRAAVAADLAGSTTSSTTTTTGQTTTTTTTTTSGVEGSVDVRLASTPADNSNIKTQNDIPVYGIEFRGKIADVSIQTVDLKVGVSNGLSNENPATLINTIKVWDGSNVLATVPVTTSTFTKDQSQIYYYRLSGLNFLVPQNTTKTLTFTFSTNSIDNERTVTIDGYSSTAIRAVSGNGVSSFYPLQNLVRTHTFKKPGTSTLTLAGASNPVRSLNYRVNGTDVLQNVTLGTFNLKSQSGDSTLLTVYATSTVTGTAPTTLYLYQGSTLLKSKSYASTVAFDNLDTTSGATVPGNDTNVTYTVKADFPSNTTTGTNVSVVVGNVAYQTPNGNTANASGSSVSNAAQYVYTSAPVFALASTPAIELQSTGNATNTAAVKATFNLNVTALGGTLIKFGNASTTVRFYKSDGSFVAATNVVVSTIPDNNVSDGTTVPVTITAIANNADLATSGLYSAILYSADWRFVGGSVVSQTYGWDDYKTPNSVNFLK